LLEKSGTTLNIEKALPVGAKPLKHVQEFSTQLKPARKLKNSDLKKKQN